MTSLNLFCTQFDQVLQILEERSFSTSTPATTTTAHPLLDYIIVDTPGQIEAFTWSASGAIFSESLASSFPTVLVFCVDTVRCAASPNTFMSNMLYACSMLYRTRLPLLIVFNKTDVVPFEFAQEWMQNYESFQQALDDDNAKNSNNSTNDGSGGGGYYSSLTRSLALVLDEFYHHLHSCGVSAATGQGLDDFWTCVDQASSDFATGYAEELRGRLREQQAKQQAIARMGIQRLQRDLDNDQEQEQQQNTT